jgi:hypothetical protein
MTGVGLIHFIDFFGKWDETRYVAWLYLALIAGTLVSSALLLGARPRQGWRWAGSLAGLTLVAYIVSRTWGLPGARDDIGNWTEPLGSASLFIEGFVVVLSTWMLGARSVPMPAPMPRPLPMPVMAERS